MANLSALSVWTVAAVAVVLVAGLVSLAWTGFSAGVWSPTPRAAIRALLRLAGVRPGDVVVDLGAGDGRVVLVAAAEFGARAVAVELDPLRARLIGWRARRAGLADRVRVVQGDLFRYPLGEADVVTAWLSQAALDRLAPRLRAQLRRGARVATYKKRFSGWPPDAADEASAVYCWVIPPARPASAPGQRPTRSGRPPRGTRTPG